MDENDIDECFRLLKLPRGADLAAVKQAYRQNLYKCHPDRFQGRPDLLPVAERKTKRLVQVYGILEKWYADHGGLDPGSPRRAPGPATAEPDPGEEGDDPGYVANGMSRWAKIGGAVAAAASFAIFVWSFFNGPKAAAPEAPGAPRVAASPPPPPAPARAAAVALEPVAAKTSEAAALQGERDRAKADWVRAYLKGWESERSAAQQELSEANAQAARDVAGRAAPIAEAERERARLLALARVESAAQRDAYAARAEADRRALRQAYDAWLISRGQEAVALIQKIREREHTRVGVFSTTEDPAKIFAFWTADEAGGPEANIAAKSGIAVRQPDSRYFPNFRSNIYLYEPEGTSLVRMMEEIVARHDALFQGIDEQRKTTEAELANWEGLHPLSPPPLEGPLAAVLAARDRALARVSQAGERLGRASRALASADQAFDQSDKGREFAARIAAARAGGSISRAQGAGSAK